MPGGQGGPRFPGFGVGRGFAIWGPFPVHAPDSAPETWTSLNKNLALHTALPVVDGFGGFGGFVFTHGHFGFQKQRAAPVCMILMIFLEARPRAGAIKATPATDLMVFPAVPDHSRPQVRLALSCRPRLGFGSRGLVVRSLRHLPWGSPPGNEIPPLRGRQKPLQDPTPVERARTVTRMAGVLNHAEKCIENAEFTQPETGTVQ